MSVLKFSPPTKETPGYLKRLKKVLAFERKLKAKQIDPNTVDELVEFLADYVTEPTDRTEAIDLLWEASEEDFDNMLSAISGSEKGDGDEGNFTNSDSE